MEAGRYWTSPTTSAYREFPRYVLWPDNACLLTITTKYLTPITLDILSFNTTLTRRQPLGLKGEANVIVLNVPSLSWPAGGNSSGSIESYIQFTALNDTIKELRTHLNDN